MKKIPKKQFDEVLRLTREYWSDDYKVSTKNPILNERIQVALTVSIDYEVDWLALIDLVEGILMRRGFCPDADNDMIYAVLNLLGWVVADEG